MENSVWYKGFTNTKWSPTLEFALQLWASSSTTDKILSYIYTYTYTHTYP